MKCLQFETTGEPKSVLQYADTAACSPKRGEVLVRMLASPINPSDLMFIRGVYGTIPQPPQTAGFEGVGIVESSDAGLKGKLFTGKRVAVLNKTGGNWADYATVPVDQVIPLSDKLSDEQAATFFVNPATAWIMTREVLKVPANAWLIQTAASSSLGRMVIRLGKAVGFRTLNIARSERHVEELKAAGATAVVVFDPKTDSSEELQTQVKKIVGHDELKYAIDPVGGPTGAAVVSLLSPNGRLITFGTLDDQPLPLNTRTLIMQQAKIEGFWLGNFMTQQNLLYKLKLIKRITRLILNGTLASHISETYSLNEFQAALEAAETPGRSGKVLLKISE